MANARKSSTLNDPFKLTILIFAIIAFMYFTAEVLKPLALSILLSFALAPPVRRLVRLGLPRSAAVVLTVVLALGLLGGLGYVVGEQLATLANKLPDYQENIEKKLSSLMKPGRQSAAKRLTTMSDRVMAKLDKPTASGVDVDTSSAEKAVPKIPRVIVVAEPSFQERLRSTTGPYLEFLGVGSFVLILVLFILMGQEDLRDRIVSLFGNRQVSLTTRTTEEIGQRISRYLATFALMNSAFGLVIGVGLALIGVPYAVLWGCLAALTRFIPYVGPAVAFILPLVFSFAYFPGWFEPLLVVALFALLETLLNSFLEPIIYGKTTGVSALGLLVAAMFWTWLWGTLGLLLSTPLTVCLAVIGKYVPGLRFFATMLGEEAELDPHVRFYQRLVSLDRQGAVEFVEEAQKKWPRAEIFDRILVPTLMLAERDAVRDDLEERVQAFIWQVIGEIVDNLEGVPELTLQSMASAPATGESSDAAAKEASAPTTIELMGLAVVDTSDVLVLKMLAQLIAPLGCHLEIVADAGSPLQVVEQVTERNPEVVVLSHVPPEGLAQSRYLVSRLRAQLSTLPIVVGRWGETGGAAAAAERLTNVGATHVVFTLADARDRILAKVFPAPEEPLTSAGGTPLKAAVAVPTPA
ncbi:AI-2E family transporter [Singulisphaera acidiphila]|uniref:Putative permease n=1 Tax=Singulisphaera acidiphila (strain ATCC BAA-1392 / DSM 18658 / VKM B-2454 / MOB10) TaxID=886293 RepID=L0D6J3_SINAD|nr:AI-2E family transporter [Singulisphaera acidiphila]AGA24857.1 putative permease [Singulisphaera acidiphila DSM 18658]